jgi:DnaJ-class molecular chaperone
VAEAYRVLGDARARRDYDARLRRSEPVGARPRVAPPFSDEPLDVFGAGGADAAEALLARFLRNFTGRGRPKSEHAEPLVCHVLLSPEEARTGGVLPIAIPILERCANCGGSGHIWPFPCIDCNATGSVRGVARAEVHIPPGVTTGTRFAASLERIGIANLFLEVAVRVADRR